MKCSAIPFAAAFLMAGSSVVAADRSKSVRLAWAVVEGAAPVEETLVAKGRLISFGKIAPMKLFTLAVDVQDSAGKVVLPKGVPLAWNLLSDGMACEPIRRRGRDTFVCLEDRDSDGSFETWATILAQEHYALHFVSYEYLVGTFTLYNRHSLLTPVASSAAVAAAFDPLSIGAKVSKGRFAFCMTRDLGKNLWGAPNTTEVCLPDTSVPKAKLPLAHARWSGSVTYHSRTPEGAIVSVAPPPAGSIIE